MIKESHTKEISANIPHAKLSIIKGNHLNLAKAGIEIKSSIEIKMKSILTTKMDTVRITQNRERISPCVNT